MPDTPPEKTPYNHANLDPACAPKAWQEALHTLDQALPKLQPTPHKTLIREHPLPLRSDQVTHRAYPKARYLAASPSKEQP
jgi:hypothetical protein